MPYYFNYVDMACSTLASLLWLVRPNLGPWPLLLAIAPWVVRLRFEGKLGVHTAFDLPLVAFLLTAVVSVWAAYDRELASAKFWLLIGAALIFYALANWQVRGGRRAYWQQAWLFSGLGAVTAIYFLLSNDWDAFPSKFPVIESMGAALQAPLPEISFQRIHPNVVGGTLAMLVPFGGAALLMAWHENRFWQKITAASLLVLTLTGLLFTMTRGSWLALLAASILVAWWPVSGLITRKNHRHRTLYFAIPVALTLGVLLVLSLWPSALSSVIKLLPATDSDGQRAVLYANALNLLQDYPLIGSGLGGFMMLYSSYSLLVHVGSITHGHNLYLNVIIEQGLVALVALAWMWLLMFEAVWRSLSVRRKGRKRPAKQTSEDADDTSVSPVNTVSGKPLRYWRVMLAAGAMSLVIMLLQGLIDDPIYNSRAAVLFFMPLAFAVPILRVSETPSRRWQLRTLGVAAGLILVAIVIWWRPLLSHFYSNLAAVEQGQRELSVYEWPEWQIQDAVRREVDLSNVVAGYERALRIQANNVSASRRLGQIELSLGNYEDALHHLLKAYQLAPWDNATRQLLGEAFITNGEVAKGELLWETVDNSASQLDLRRFWYEYLGEDPPLSYMLQANSG